MGAGDRLVLEMHGLDGVRRGNGQGVRLVALTQVDWNCSAYRL